MLTGRRGHLAREVNNARGCGSNTQHRHEVAKAKKRLWENQMTVGLGLARWTDVPDFLGLVTPVAIQSIVESASFVPKTRGLLNLSEGGGIMNALIITAIFSDLIDHRYWRAAAFCFVAIWFSMFGADAACDTKLTTRPHERRPAQASCTRTTSRVIVLVATGARSGGKSRGRSGLPEMKDGASPSPTAWSAPV